MNINAMLSPEYNTILVDHSNIKANNAQKNNTNKLENYQLIKTLGTGTFGRVYLSKQKTKKSYYAIKVLNKEQVYNLKQVEHVLSEKKLLSEVKHCFIVNLIEHFKDTKNLYMVMEFVIGGEMFSHLRKLGKFDLKTTRFYITEIVSALDYLHTKDIVYRDLKPENILIDINGHVKITDFGFAKKVEERTWTLCGTPEYLAPEIIQSKGHGKACDWWALGVLTYEMLVGYPPFYDDNPFGIYEKILKGKVYYPIQIDPTSKDLIRKLLVLDTTKRLGNLKNGSLDIKTHHFFNSINWENLLYDMQYTKGPIVPSVRHNGDSSNFDEYDEVGINDICDLNNPINHQFDEYEHLFVDF